MYRFLVTASILVLLGFVYLGQRLVVESWQPILRYSLWGLLFLMVLNLLWLPWRRWRRQHTGRVAATRLTRLLESGAYSVMGFLSLLLLFTVVTEIPRTIAIFFPRSVYESISESLFYGASAETFLSLFVLVFATVFFVWGRIRVFRGAQYRFIKIVLPLTGKAKRRPRFKKRKTSGEKIRMVQVSDLHIGRAIEASYTARVVEKINAAGADIVCFTGDIADGSIHTMLSAAAPLADIEATVGVFYVPGNHEYYWGVKPWLQEFERLDMRILLNRGEKIKLPFASVWIAGVSDPTAARFGETLPKIPKRDSSDIAVLLTHQPIFVRGAEAEGYDILLAGHTHGGQYAPWSWMVHLFYRFARGLYRFRNMLVYVSDGTGYWGAPLKIGTRLEITVFDIYLQNGSD